MHMEELCKMYKNLSNENETKFLDNFRFPMAYYHCLAIDYHLKKSISNWLQISLGQLCKLLSVNHNDNRCGIVWVALSFHFLVDLLLVDQVTCVMTHGCSMQAVRLVGFWPLLCGVKRALHNTHEVICLRTSKQGCPGKWLPIIVQISLH